MDCQLCGREPASGQCKRCEKHICGGCWGGGNVCWACVQEIFDDCRQLKKTVPERILHLAESGQIDALREELPGLLKDWKDAKDALGE